MKEAKRERERERDINITRKR